MSDPMLPFDDAAPPAGGAGVRGSIHSTKSTRLPLTPPARHNAPAGTSDEAARRIAGGAAALRERVFAYIVACGDDGATDAETQAALGMLTQTQTPRRGELVQLGLVVDSGRRRLTPQGRPAAVWVAASCADGSGEGGTR
mgnify:CR=1 FL=1